MTAPDLESAEKLVRALVEERIIACGNIVPGLLSIYRWKGGVERSGEVLIIAKTTEAEVPRLLERAPELHPYEVPEVLVFPVGEGYGPYLDWVLESVAPDQNR
jgi:periplasmic divalent cation tolerance protein